MAKRKEFKVKGLDNAEIVKEAMMNIINGADKDTVKLASRQADILTMFMVRKELTYEDVQAMYKASGEELHITTVSKTMDLMVEEGLLARQRRKCKRYVEGHQKSKSLYFHWVVDPIVMDMMERMRKDIVAEHGEESVPKLEFMPSAVREREMYKEKQKMKATAEEKPVPRTEEVKMPKEEPTPKPKPEPKKEEPMGKTVQDMFAQMTFSEALVKVYSGHKIVSAVSGNVYSMVDEGALKGITSSAKPGAIISFFPANEMEGKWRLMESPKTCPYCGGMVKLVQYDSGTMFYYHCVNEDCKATGPKARTPEEAVRKFNKRC